MTESALPWLPESTLRRRAGHTTRAHKIASKTRLPLPVRQYARTRVYNMN
jgi:hypothetical protein